VAGVNDLVAWLRGQIDEDERVAREAARANPGSAAEDWSAERVDYQDSTSGIWGKVWGIVPRRVKGIVLAVCPADILPRMATHIVRHDPAQVLREVETKRRIIDDLAAVISDDEDMGYFSDGHSGLAVAKRTLNYLALPYADHPGYRKEWKP
jgi:hypothetical protein